MPALLQLLLLLLPAAAAAAVAYCIDGICAVAETVAHNQTQMKFGIKIDRRAENWKLLESRCWLCATAFIGIKRDDPKWLSQRNGRNYFAAFHRIR